MIPSDLWKRVNDARKEQGLSELGMDEVETLDLDARRVLAEELGLHFGKEISITITSGVGYLYRLSPATNTDVLWHLYGRAVHSDGSISTEVSILPYGATSRDLTYERAFQGYYWAVIEPNGNDVTITVWLADGSGAAPDGTVACDFQFVQTLASWPIQYEPHLVAKVVEMSAAQAAT